MKGDVDLLFAIFMVIIGAAIVLGVFYYTSGGSDIGQAPDVKKGDIEINIPYNYKNVILDSKGFDTKEQYEAYFESDIFCEKLKNCIKTNILTGSPCTVDIVTYEGTGLDDISIKDIYPDTSKCDVEYLNISLGYDTWQYVCEYDANGIYDNLESWKLQQDNGLDFDECEFIEGPPYDEIVRYQEELPSNWLSFRYKVNDNFNHYYNNVNGWYNVIGNGPGKIKIVVGKTKIMSDGVCRFSTRICPQPAIATDESSATLKVFDIFRRLEIFYQDESDLPYYIKKEVVNTYDPEYAIMEKYIWAKQTIELDKPYSITTISSAVISGFNKNPYEYYWFPNRDPEEHDDTLVSWGIGTRDSFNLKHMKILCGDDNICEGKLTIKTNLIFNHLEDTDDPPYIKANIIITEE